MIECIIEFSLIGIIGGLLGTFYRNCLKAKNMIFNFIYYDWLKPWAECVEDIEESGYKPKFLDKFKAWIARPLGYCIYCSSTWITIFLSIIYYSSWNILPDWQHIVISVITACSMQHIVVAILCRFLINNHPDL